MLQKAFIKDKSQQRGQNLRAGEGQPEPGQSKPGKQKSQGYKEYYCAHNGQKRALESLAYCLKEDRKGKRRNHGDKAQSDKMEPKLSDFHDPFIRGKDSQHGTGNRLKAENAHKHQSRSKQDGGGQSLFAAADVPGRVVKADDRHNAGLHGAQRDEEKGLPFIVEAEGSHRLIGETGQNQVQAQDVKGIGRLHENIRNAQKEDLPDAPGIEMPGGRFPEALFHHDKSRHDLSCHRGDGSARDAKLRQAEHAEDQQRVEDYIGQGSRDLGQHRRLHVAGGLQNLRPDAFQKQAEAEQADDAPVCGDILNDFRGVRGHPGISRQEEPAGKGKDSPHSHRQRRADARELVRFLRFSQAKASSHGRIDAYAGSRCQSDHQKLERVDDGEGRQARFGVAAYEQAVHDIIERLNELCQHDRRRDFE